MGKFKTGFMNERYRTVLSTNNVKESEYVGLVMKGSLWMCCILSMHDKKVVCFLMDNG